MQIMWSKFEHHVIYYNFLNYATFYKKGQM